jgi:hypothetical protein
VTGRCEKIDFAKISSEPKCMPKVQRSLIRHPGAIFFRPKLLHVSKSIFSHLPDGTFPCARETGEKTFVFYLTRIALADFGEFLGWFADRTILLMKNHPLLGGASLISCLLLNLRSQASRCVKQTTATGRQLGLFAASHCYYVMLVKSEVFQARHIYLDAAFRRSVPRVSLKSRNLVTGR